MNEDLHPPDPGKDSRIQLLSLEQGSCGRTAAAAKILEAVHDCLPPALAVVLPGLRGSSACTLRLAIRNGLFLNDHSFPMDSFFLIDGHFLGEVIFLHKGLFLKGIARGGACECYILGRLQGSRELLLGIAGGHIPVRLVCDDSHGHDSSGAWGTWENLHGSGKHTTLFLIMGCLMIWWMVGLLLSWKALSQILSPNIRSQLQ